MLERSRIQRVQVASGSRRLRNTGIGAAIGVAVGVTFDQIFGAARSAWRTVYRTP